DRDEDSGGGAVVANRLEQRPGGRADRRDRLAGLLPRARDERWPGEVVELVGSQLADRRPERIGLEEIAFKQLDSPPQVHPTAHALDSLLQPDRRRDAEDPSRLLVARERVDDLLTGGQVDDIATDAERARNRVRELEDRVRLISADVDHLVARRLDERRLG